MLTLGVGVQDVTPPIPSALQTLISSTLIPPTPVPPPATVTGIPTMTMPGLILPTSTSTPPAPTLAETAGAVTGTIAAIFILVIAFICWRRRNKRTRGDRLRRGGRPGGMAGWRTPVRANTGESFVIGKEESDDPSTGLLSKKKTQRFWTSPHPSDSRVGYTGLAARVTMLVPREYQQIPPQPPPSHLKPVPRAAGPATPALFSSRPFDNSSHSPSGSYDQSYRYYYGISPTNSIPSTAVSISTPFSPVKPSTAWDGNTPPSSASSPGAQEKQRILWGGRRAATEGSVPHTPATSASANTAAPHSPSGPSPTRASANGHRRNLTIDTSITSSRALPDIPREPQENTVAVTGLPADSTQVGAHDTNAPSGLTSLSPNDRPKSNSTAEAEAKKLQDMFAFDPSLSDDEIHKSIHQVYQQSPTDGGHDMSSPAVPESATTEMYGIGLGVMSRGWEPWQSDANSRSNHTSLHSSGKRSMKSVKSVRTPPSPMRFQSLITKRSAAALSMSTVSGAPSPGAGAGAATPPTTPGQRPATSSRKSSSDRESESGGRKSTGTLAGLLEAYGVAPSPTPSQEGKGTIFELDEDVLDVPGMPESGGGAPASASALSEGGDGGTQGRNTAQLVGQRPLAPRNNPPRRSVVPEDFSEDALLNLSRESTQRW